MPERDLATLLRTLQPALRPVTIAFCEIPCGAPLPPDAIASFVESESITVLLPINRARAIGLPVVFEAAWITLAVQSDLAAVGLTAAVATALADAGISCNVIAAVHHDHLFVPAADADRAIETLRSLQARPPV